MNKINVKNILTKKNLLIAGSIILTGFILTYGYIAGSDYLLKLGSLDQNKQLIASLEQEVIQSNDNLVSSQEKVKDLESQINQGLEKILPSTSGKEELVRELDDLERLLNRSENKFFVSNVSFGAEKDMGSGLKSISMSITINSSRENFLRFLDYIENSGSVNSPSRLMEISNISVNFSESIEGLQNQVTITVNLDAYFKLEA